MVSALNDKGGNDMLSAVAKRFFQFVNEEDGAIVINNEVLDRLTDTPVNIVTSDFDRGDVLILPVA
jgi:hypothetical protein